MEKARTYYALAILLLLFAFLATAASFSPDAIEARPVIINGLTSVWLIVTLITVVQMLLDKGNGGMSVSAIIIFAVTVFLALINPQDWRNYLFMSHPATLVIGGLITIFHILDYNRSKR
jgi:hypothetical protein